MHATGKLLLKTVLFALFLLVVLALGMFVVLAANSRSMTVTLGADNGRLLPCPASPNCVSSDDPAGDSHHIAPFANIDATAWRALVDSVSMMDGVEVITRESNYTRFTFRTPLLGFMDDVEFLYRPEAGEVAVRSASRVGYGDMNTNRKRIEAIRKPGSDHLNKSGGI